MLFVGMILNSNLIAQSTLVIPEVLQSGFLALLAKFDFAIPIPNCNGNYVLIHGLLPRQLEPPVQSITNPTVVKKKFKTLGKLRKSFRKKIKAVDSTVSSAVPDIVINTTSDSSDDVKDAYDHDIDTNDDTPKDFTDASSDHPRPVDKDLVSKEDNVDGFLDSFAELTKTSTSYKKIPSSLPKIHKANVFKPNLFPQLSIVNSPVFEATSDLSSPHEMPSVGGFSLRTTTLHPVLHPSLCRVWLASFVPDGFWPQLFTRIISDDRIKSVLSILLFTPLKNNECTLDYASSSVPPLWKLHQKGLTIEHEKIDLLQLKQVSSKFDKFTNQIELIVCIREISLVYKNYKESESHKSTGNVIRLATSILVLIEQHILDIGEEWFPGVFCGSHNKDVLSFVPCSVCISPTDDQSTSHLASTSQQVLCFNGRQAICFSLKDLLVAHAQPSRSVKCPLHNEIPVQQLAPDMVSMHIILSLYTYYGFIINSVCIVFQRLG